MAKKKESHTLEERLENALVSDWEQPYKVPSNWVWTRGNTIFIPTESKKPDGNKFYYIDIESIDNKNQKIREPKLLEVSKAPSRASRGLNTGDTIFSTVRPYLKNIAYIDETFQSAIASTGFYVCRPNKIQPRFLYWLMCSGYVVDGLNKFMKGDNSPSIRKENIVNFAYPIPPLAEQERIVERIESLFTKLDEAKEKTQNALDSFENRKAAILHKAFIGELTRKWREENGVGVETRILKPLSAVCSSFQYGTSSKSVNDGSIAVIRMGNLQNGEIDWSDLVFSNNEEDNNKYELKVGDVLFNRTNSPALVGKTSIYRGDFPAIFAGYLIRLNYGDELIGDYLNYMMNTHQAKEYCNSVKSDGVNQSNINAKKIAAFIIPVPSIAEQTEIVRILDNIFKKEKQAKELASVIEKIDLMKKAILARAFRGELGTNNPEEESALNLLKEIMSKENKIEQKPNKKQISIPKSISKQFKTDLEEQVYRVILENQNSTLNQILSGISSSKHLDAMEVITILSDKGLIDKKDDLYFTK